MCGICGIVGPGASRPESRDTVERMMGLLAHRGPDGEGLCGEPGFVFGHRRLAIIDREHGGQPMVDPEAGVTLVFNGEIYNFVELRQELIQRGMRFRTFSDTEVILCAYKAYGVDCVRHFNGMFAFALHDSRNGLFFAARDHFGVKPFYYALAGQDLVFASEIKALFAHPELRPGVAPEALAHYFAFQFCLGEGTLFRDVLRLAPGHCLIRRSGGPVRIEKYWEIDFTPDTYHTEDYFIDRTKLLLQDSIRGQLRSDVPVGAYLSGGLDSSSVVSHAAKLYGRGLKCFTGRFEEGPDYDESAYARIVSRDNDCEYFEAIPHPSDFIELLPKLIYHMDEPAAGPGLFPQYVVSRLAKRHVTVVLGGQGGDEIFGGYIRYMVAYLEQCLKGAIFETSEEGKFVVTLESLIPNLPLMRNYVPMLDVFWRQGLFEPQDRRYFRLIDRSPDIRSILTPEAMAGFDEEAVFAAFQTVFHSSDTKSYFNKMTRFDQKTLLPALLQVEDRVSMAVSLESRVPILDPRLAELVASMPPTLKFQNGTPKYVLQRAMSSLLPEPILKRKDKMGFPVPLKEWWKGPLRDFVADILLARRSTERGIFDTAGLEALLDRETRFGRQIWGALCLELWHRIFIDGESPV